MKWHSITLLAVALLAACSAPKEETTPAFSYEYKTIRTESLGGCNQPLFPCASFEVSWPEFDQMNSSVKATLSDRINYAVAYDDPDADDFSLQQMADAFVRDFNSFQNEFPENQFSWYFKSHVEILSNTQTILSLSAVTEHYTGGAHGNRTVYFININPENGEDITLNSVFKTGYESALRSEAEKAFRKARELDEYQDLTEAGFEFPEGKFELNSNYGFGSNGIVFCFNAYEIAPYAMGPTEFTVPWSALKEYRK
jgi:hypothetical protein